MAETGIRELRNHLSKYLARVRNGEAVTITDRGRAVARLVPMDHTRPYDRLVADGIIEPPRSPMRTRPEKRVAVPGPVSELVANQRR